MTKIGLTEELINTRFAPVAALLTYYQAHEVLKPLETVTVAMKTIDFAPADKLLQVLVSLLPGAAISRWSLHAFTLSTRWLKS